MPGLLPNVDPDGLLEFSVVYTDRALNHMSRSFQGVMKDISAILKDVYKAHSTVMSPPYAGAPVGGSGLAAGGGVAFGDVSGDRVDSGAGVPFQGADGGVPGAGQQQPARCHRNPFPPFRCCHPSLHLWRRC